MADGQHTVSRRDLLKTSAAAATLTIVPRHVLGGEGRPAANERLNIAAVGVGGMGANNLAACAGENIVALCDVDAGGYAAKTIAKYPQAKVYKDYRVMFDQQKDIDAVIVATPDHTHALVALAAIRRGKHVYVQKPLAHNIDEARVLTEEARKHKVMTQMGNQGRSGDGPRLISEWIADGAIGAVREVHCWTNRPVWPQSIEVERPKVLEKGRRMGDDDGGVLFVGDKGLLMCGCFGKGARLIPESRMKEYQIPAPTLPRVPGGESGHEKDWVRACKDGKPSSANFDYSGPFAETVLMGNLAIRFPFRQLQWDGAKMEVTNDKDADAYVRRQYRSGWTL